MGCDSGLASVVAAALVAVLVVVAGAVLALGQVVVVRQRAATAADLAALAGASAVLRGGVDAEVCDRAAAVARAGGARLEACEVAGADVVVEVSHPLPRLAGALVRWGGADAVRVRARAGPPAVAAATSGWP